MLKRGFALLYVILFVFLITLTVVAGWAASMTDLRLQRQSTYSAEAYQLARSAIDDAWVKYYDGIRSIDPYQAYTYPNDACVEGSSKIYRVYPNSPTERESEETNLQAPVPADEAVVGFYAYRICASAGPEDEPETDHIINQAIEGIGYYQGSKVTLKADIKHKDREICDDPSADDPSVCSSHHLDHSKDTMFIYQTGPSAQ